MLFSMAAAPSCILWDLLLIGGCGVTMRGPSNERPTLPPNFPLSFLQWLKVVTMQMLPVANWL